jgi:cyclic-di-AMP phosphodiesterase PgpH
MPREQTKPSIRARTEDLRREIEQSGAAGSGWSLPLRSGNFVWAAVIWATFVVLVGTAAIWSREQPGVEPGRVMAETRTAREKFSFADEAAKRQAETMARARAPRVYVAAQGLLDDIEAGLESLPLISRDATTAEQVEPGLRQQFGLTDAALAALREDVGESEISGEWHDRVQALKRELAVHPLLDAKAAQLESQSLNKEMELRKPDGGATIAPSSSAINIESPEIGQRLRQMARDAGFQGPLLDVVVTRLTQPGIKPTYVFDPAATAASQDTAAANVTAPLVTYPEGEVIYRRGDVLTASQLEVTREAIGAALRAQSFGVMVGSRAAVMGMVAAIAAAMLGYAVLFVPRIRRNPWRMGAIAALLGILAIVAIVSTTLRPGMVAITATGPTVFCAFALCIAYSQRIALAFGALHGLLVCAALDLPIGQFAVLVAGVGAAVWQLKEIRDRDTLIRTGTVVGLALAAATMLANLVQLPLIPAAILQAGVDSGLAACAGLGVAMLMLFVLPTMEKSFSITTGLTLIELRDPKHPLLRQLQQRAPGTYNHSLTLGALGEAAAEAIGADGLLTYVGALYHDIGKMNKPDYFVENQQPGFNRHDKLSPAMSLLIIVGHVKDGLELAREFNLPRSLWHFIESHHGTTLVEYFFHRAKRRAETLWKAGGEISGDEDDGPTEMEYRYPGPRPRTKEAAIVMICDAVESAARAMADPTPSRIDTLVRAIATKRLMDGQFDECDLTLRDLNRIVEAVSRTLASIYHGRIAYPGDDSKSAGPKTVVPVAGTIGDRNVSNVSTETKPREPVRT